MAICSSSDQRILNSGLRTISGDLKHPAASPQEGSEVKHQPWLKATSFLDRHCCESALLGWGNWRSTFKGHSSKRCSWSRLQLLKMSRLPSAFPFIGWCHHSRVGLFLSVCFAGLMSAICRYTQNFINLSGHSYSNWVDISQLTVTVVIMRKAWKTVLIKIKCGVKGGKSHC